MAIMDGLRNSILSWLFPITNSEATKRIESLEARRRYRSGDHELQLKVRAGSYDDNIFINLIKLITARSVALLVGFGVEWQLPGADEESSPEGDYLVDVWRQNRKAILLHNAATQASDAGTGFIRIIPDAITSQTTGELLPRLIVLDPELVTEIKTLPEDKDVLVGYVIMYSIPTDDGTKVKKQEITRLVSKDPESGQTVMGDTWSIIDYEEQHGKWVEVNNVVWEYEFPPIIHWQNLPNPIDVWGEPDVTDDVLRLQNHINLAASNIGKIIRIYAHPQRYGVNLGKQDKMDVGIDMMPNFSGDNAEIRQLEAGGDIAGSIAYLTMMVQSAMDTTRTVDLHTMADKLGALTNFALKVLYFDALQKLNTKRELFGEMILELNRRLLVLGGYSVEDVGEIIWPLNVLPVDNEAEVRTLKEEVDAGFMSKEDAIKARGRDPEKVKIRIAAEKDEDAKRQNNLDLGGMLLRMRDFNLNGSQPGTKQQLPKEKIENNGK